MKQLKRKWSKTMKINEVIWIECLIIKRVPWLKIMKEDSKNSKIEKHQNLMTCNLIFKNKLMISNVYLKKNEQIYMVMPKLRDKKCKLKLMILKNS